MLKSLQKSDKDTNELIDKMRDYLFSVGIRTTRERAWDIFLKAHEIPYDTLLKNNQEIEYQGNGKHILQSTHESQILVIRNLGRYELKGIKGNSGKTRKASIKFIPSEKIKNKVEESVKVND